MSTEFIVQMAVYALSFGCVFGTLQTKLKYLEQKMDRHNNVLERLAIVERDIKTAHERVDELCKEHDYYAKGIGGTI